jgi:hypothetical protein
MTTTMTAPAPSDECSVCKDTFSGQATIRLACGHYFHSPVRLHFVLLGLLFPHQLISHHFPQCGQQWFHAQQPCKCPLCRAPFTTTDFFTAAGDREAEEPPTWRETKAAALAAAARREQEAADFQCGCPEDCVCAV